VTGAGATTHHQGRRHGRSSDRSAGGAQSLLTSPAGPTCTWWSVTTSPWPLPSPPA